jgi:hypothetical protein
MNADHAATPLAKKLGITDDSVFTVLHAPAGFAGLLGDVGDAVWQRNLMPPIDVVLTFHRERGKLMEEWPTVSEAALPDGAVWIAWPKQGSGLITDLTEDVLRHHILRTDWVDNKVCSIDATWSALRFVPRKEHRHRRR